MRFERIGFTACVLAALCSCSKNNVSPVAAVRPIEVTTMIVSAKDVPVSFEFVAQTQSSHQVNIQARVSGFLDKRVYVEGDIVKEGQVLFEMDKEPFIVQVNAQQAAVNRQKAALETARLNLDRVKPLAKLNALSQKDLDDAVGNFQTTGASLEQAQANLENALLNLSYCTITSPLDGITSAALQQDGTYLNVSDSLLTTVSALDPIWVNFSLSENQLETFRDQAEKGQLLAPADGKYLVKIIQVNGKEYPFRGAITFTEPYFNPQTGTFLIRASVVNPDARLRPNQYVRAIVEGSIRPKAILIPQRSVQSSSKGKYVWVINKVGKAEFRPVIVGDWQGENWFITEGLQPGEEVVVDGGLKLQAGSLVTKNSATKDSSNPK